MGNFLDVHKETIACLRWALINIDQLQCGPNLLAVKLFDVTFTKWELSRTNVVCKFSSERQRSKELSTIVDKKSRLDKISLSVIEYT